MPNRMFIINRLSGMAYERLSGSNAAARCSFQQRAGGTGRWSACVCQSFSPRVYRQSFAKFVFRPTKRRAISFQYGLVGRACRESLLRTFLNVLCVLQVCDIRARARTCCRMILEERTTWRDENSIGNTDCATSTHLAPNLTRLRFVVDAIRS